MWGNWSSCSSTCGIATKTRTRTCSQPAPKNGGAQCPGNQTQTHACFDRACPGIFISMFFFIFFIRIFDANETYSKLQLASHATTSKTLCRVDSDGLALHLVGTPAVGVIFFMEWEFLSDYTIS